MGPPPPCHPTDALQESIPDQPTLFQEGRQGHKRRSDENINRSESTCPSVDWLGNYRSGGGCPSRKIEACPARSASRWTMSSTTRAGKNGARAPHSGPAGCCTGVGACRSLEVGLGWGRDTLVTNITAVVVPAAALLLKARKDRPVDSGPGRR
ncbi:hypothetical protein N9L68_05525 [bacterium]|nr:hypothetical protein [bacterium]